jgi:hypothetical protein
MFFLLPLEIRLFILELFGQRDRDKAALVCKRWKKYVTEKMKPIVPLEGLECWFTVNNGLTVTKAGQVLRWESERGTNHLYYKESIKGQNGREIKSSGPPLLESKVTPTGKSGVFFDYAHTAFFRRCPKVRTIVSVHSFVASELSHTEVHGYVFGADILDQFYIFTDQHRYHLHGGDPLTEQSEPNLASGFFAHRNFLNGTLRLQRGETRPVSHSRLWIGEGVKLAVLTLAGTLTEGLTRIGADRTCHHFCGHISELLLYDRVLTEEEIDLVESYLQKKYQLY